MTSDAFASLFESLAHKCRSTRALTLLLWAPPLESRISRVYGVRKTAGLGTASRSSSERGSLRARRSSRAILPGAQAERECPRAGTARQVAGHPQDTL